MSSIHQSNRKGRLTQRLVNTYPDWSDLRSDLQSTGRQLFNSIGTALDDLTKRLFDSLDGFHLATTPPSDVGLSYRVKLPQSYSFTKIDNDDTYLGYTTPTVSGLYDESYYAVSLATDNSVINFWRDAIPSRISVSDTISDPTLIDTTIVDDVVFNAPFAPQLLSGVVGVPNKLTVTMSGGTNYIPQDNRNIFNYGSVRIKGDTENGLKEIAEEVVFLEDGKKQTLNSYSTISGVDVYNILPSGTSIKITSMDFNNGPYKSNYDISYSEDGFNISTHWNLTSGFNSSFSLLDHQVPIHPNPDIRLGGFPGVYTDIQQRLVDINGNNISAVDMAVQPNSDLLWVTTNTKLLCYSSEIPYINLKTLKNKTADPGCRIVTADDYVPSGETTTIQFYWKSPAKGLERHRILVEHEDGTKYAVVDGALTTYSSSTDYWIYGEPYNRWLREPFVGTLPKQGLFTFILESRFADESTEVDRRVIVSDKTSVALSEYDLSSAGITYSIVSIDFDTYDNIWLKDCHDNLIKIQRHYDKMLIDFEEKVIYLRENYDKVIVS